MPLHGGTYDKSSHLKPLSMRYISRNSPATQSTTTDPGFRCHSSPPTTMTILPILEVGMDWTLDQMGRKDGLAGFGSAIRMNGLELRLRWGSWGMVGMRMPSCKVPRMSNPPHVGCVPVSLAPSSFWRLPGFVSSSPASAVIS